MFQYHLYSLDITLSMLFIVVSPVFAPPVFVAQCFKCNNRVLTLCWEYLPEENKHTDTQTQTHRHKQ